MNLDKYYIKNVDTEKDSIYCHHDLMGELLIPTHQHEKAQMLYTEGGIVYVVTESKTYFLPARHFHCRFLPGFCIVFIPVPKKVMMRNLYFPVEVTEPHLYLQEGIYPVTDVLLHMLLFTNQMERKSGQRKPELQSWQKPSKPFYRKLFKIICRWHCLFQKIRDW